VSQIASGGGIRHTRRVAKKVARNDQACGDDRALFDWWRELADELADEGSLARGVVYALDGRVERLEIADRSLTAVVRGSHPYRVTLSGSRNAPRWSCDCPVGSERTFCKHCVAVALVASGEDGEPAGPGSVVDEVGAYLESLDRARLVELVIEQAGRDDAFRERLVVRAAAAAGATIDVRDRRQRVKRAFGTGRFIDYRHAPQWAFGVNETLDELEELLDAGFAIEVVELVEYAHARAETAIQHIDDSDGWITAISVRLGELHVRACTEARIDPVALARRLMKLELAGELDTFHRAALMYASALGPAGIDEYRRLLEPRFAALAPGEDWSHERFRVRNARVGVALAARDPDELIAVKGNDLRLPDDYAEIAGLLAETGRIDDAIGWCEQGLTDHADRTWQLAPLRELLAQFHRDRGDTHAALEVFWTALEQRPSLDAYRRLIREADAADGGQSWRADALAALQRLLGDAERTGSQAHVRHLSATIIEVLLFEGRVDDAWRAATERDCDQRLWMQLAWARESEHPEDVIPIYEHEVEALINKKNDAGYRDAVKLMVHVNSLHVRFECPDAFAMFVERVRAPRCTQRPAAAPSGTKSSLAPPTRPAQQVSLSRP
jgi:uncharacterized Zn finger protein